MVNWSVLKILVGKLRRLTKNTLIFGSKIRDAKHEAK